MKQKTGYKIGEVLDRRTNKRSEKWSYRIGRECLIDDRTVQVGLPLIVEYPTRCSFFRTSLVEEIEQTDRGVWITTKNSIYRFDNLSTLDAEAKRGM